jgi:hypothetical protein
MHARFDDTQSYLISIKNKFNTKSEHMVHIYDVKLIRTNITLYLSQKAKKHMS